MHAPANPHIHAPALWQPIPALTQAGRTLRVGGWVKTGREAGAGAFGFLEVNDGSMFDSLQVRLKRETARGGAFLGGGAAAGIPSACQRPAPPPLAAPPAGDGDQGGG